MLDPCTGTGSYLTAVLDKIITTLKDQGGDGLVAAEAKQAALSRIHGFELLPAPFVIAHLQLGLALQASRYRDRHMASRAKSDPGDALVLAHLLRTDGHRRRV